MYRFLFKMKYNIILRSMVLAKTDKNWGDFRNFIFYIYESKGTKNLRFQFFYFKFPFLRHPLSLKHKSVENLKDFDNNLSNEKKRKNRSEISTIR